MRLLLSIIATKLEAWAIGSTALRLYDEAVATGGDFITNGLAGSEMQFALAKVHPDSSAARTIQRCIDYLKEDRAALDKQLNELIIDGAGAE